MKLFQKLHDDLGSSVMCGDTGHGLGWLRKVLLAVFAEYGDFHFAVFLLVSLFPPLQQNCIAVCVHWSRIISASDIAWFPLGTIVQLVCVVF